MLHRPFELMPRPSAKEHWPLHLFGGSHEVEASPDGVVRGPRGVLHRAVFAIPAGFHLVLPAFTLLLKGLQPRLRLDRVPREPESLLPQYP